ncbi:MAG: hypothetical protein ABJH04_07645 [Cyclobacteriaceae bacterium]
MKIEITLSKTQYLTLMKVVSIGASVMNEVDNYDTQELINKLTIDDFEKWIEPREFENEVNAMITEFCDEEVVYRLSQYLSSKELQDKLGKKEFEELDGISRMLLTQERQEELYAKMIEDPENLANFIWIQAID